MSHLNEKLTFIMHHFSDNWIEPISSSPNGTLIKNTLFSLNGIQYCKWYQDISMTSNGWQEELIERLKTKKETLNHIIYTNSRGVITSHISSGFSIFAQYVVWCDENCNSNYALDHPRKARLFLEARLAESEETWNVRTSKQQKNISDHLAKTLHNSYKVAIPHLNQLIEWQGYYYDLHACEEIESIRRKLLHMFKTAKTAKCDSAATSALQVKRLNENEMDKMMENLWLGKGIDLSFKSKKGMEHAQMKSLIAALLNNSMGRRGGDLRNIDLRTLFLYHLTPVGPCNCQVVGISLRDVKEDDILYDKEHLFGLVRNKNRLHCAVGMLAMYLVWLNDITGDIDIIQSIKEDVESAVKLKLQHPDQTYEPNWYHIPLLAGRSKVAPISSSQHRSLTKAGFACGDIDGKKCVTHIFRPTVLGKLLEGGVSSTDSALYQGWVHGVWADTYAKGAFKTKPMLCANGWDPKLNRFFCWWEGRYEDVPHTLASQVFPGLDELRTICEAAYSDHQIDKSALEFVKLLQYLRKVFIEDSILHYSSYKDFPAYQHSIFKTHHHLEWLAYKCTEEQRIQSRENKWKVKQDNPAVVSFIEEQAQKNAEFQQSLVDIISHHVQSAAKISAAKANKNNTLVETVPIIPDVHPQSLLITYKSWTESSLKDYVQIHGKILWSKAFAENKVTIMKNRFHKIKPFWLYIDQCVESGMDAAHACMILDDIRKKYKVDVSVFVKQCIYHIFYPAAETARKPPPISAKALCAEMQSKGLLFPLAPSTKT